jgi:GNAT superfamily N-acetyltransferase
MSRDELLATFDAQMRGRVRRPLPPSAEVVPDGPLLRMTGLEYGGFIEYRDLAGADGAALDELIARQVRAFAERGERFEWKLYGHDLPADLPERLRAAGLVPEDEETVLVASAEAIAREPELPPGVALREVAGPAGFARVGERTEAVWPGEGGAHLAESLAAERAADPAALAVVAAEAGAVTVCAAWIRFPSGSEFATLWGGGTLPDWRGRGIYRALVGYRARLAAARGYRWLQVDASSESRPILERLGFVALTTTTPYVWTPPGRPAS